MFSDIMRKSQKPAYADYIYQTHQSEYQLVRLSDVTKIYKIYTVVWRKVRKAATKRKVLREAIYKYSTKR